MELDHRRKMPSFVVEFFGYNRPMRAPHPALVTEVEFLALPESMQRMELIDGEVIVAPSPSPRHQLVLQRLVRALMDWADRQQMPALVGQSPWDVRFGPDRILQPDAFVLLASYSPDQDGPLDQIPQLCIEVVSGNRVYDRVTKRFIYAEAGVQELWIVELQGLVECWTDEGLVASTVVEDTLTSPLLPGFELVLSELFRGLRRPS